MNKIENHKIKVFDYIPELDCFAITKEFKDIADALHLTEWHEAVWIGRYFILDNDYGEHWFDNWDERDAIEKAAEELGYQSEFLFVIDPSRFENGHDGPCHDSIARKMFWTDTLQCFSLSLKTIFHEARNFPKHRFERITKEEIENQILIIQSRFKTIL